MSISRVSIVLGRFFITLGGWLNFVFMYIIPKTKKFGCVE